MKARQALYLRRLASLAFSAVMWKFLAGGGYDLDRAKRFGRVLGEAYQLLDDATDGDGAAGEIGRDNAAKRGQELLAELRLIDPEIAGIVLEAMR